MHPSSTRGTPRFWRFLRLLGWLGLSWAVGVTMGFSRGAFQGYRHGLVDGWAAGYNKGSRDGFERAAERTGCHPFGTWPDYRVVICQAAPKIHK